MTYDDMLNASYLTDEELVSIANQFEKEYT